MKPFNIKNIFGPNISPTTNTWICYTAGDLPFVKAINKGLLTEGIKLHINDSINPTISKAVPETQQRPENARFLIVVVNQHNWELPAFQQMIKYAADNKKLLIGLVNGQLPIQADIDNDLFYMIRFAGNIPFQESIGLLAKKIDPELTLDAFISYAREDKKIAAKINEALVNHKKSTWIDENDIMYTEKWWKAIEVAIESSENFIFIITPASVKSNYCNKELAFAVQYNKRIIPVLAIDVHENDVPESLQQIHWLQLKENDLFSEKLSKLIDAIDADPGYVKSHTKYLVKAREWINSDRSAQYLLKGKSLTIAEKWYKLAASASKQPALNSLQITYFKASHRRRMTRNILLITLAFLFSFYLTAQIGYSTYYSSKDLVDRYTRYTDINVYDSGIFNWFFKETFLVLFAITCMFFLLYRRLRDAYVIRYWDIVFIAGLLVSGLYLFLFKIFSGMSEYYDYSSAVIAMVIVTLAVFIYSFARNNLKHRKIKNARYLTITASLFCLCGFAWLAVFGTGTPRDNILNSALKNRNLKLIQEYAKDTSRLSNAVSSLTAWYYNTNGAYINTVALPLTYATAEFIQSKDFKNFILASVNAGIPFNTTDEAGETLAHYAVMFNQEDILNTLIKKGLNINTVNGNGWSLLMTAVHSRHIGLVDKLIKAGAKVNLKANDGSTALLLAVSTFNNYNYAVDPALCDSNCAITNLLIENGAEVNATDSSGNSPLVASCSFGCFKIIKLLVDKGAHFVQSGEYDKNPVWLVISHKIDTTGEAVGYLASHGCFSGPNDSVAFKCFFEALQNRQEANIKALEKYGISEDKVLFSLSEHELNTYGYQLLYRNQTDEAIMVFNINTRRFPASPNTWESLGEAYARNGNRELAIINIKKSLTMNPSEDLKNSATEYLERLNKKQSF